MKYKMYQYPRGVNEGGVLSTDVCPTISCSSWQNNCFLIEIEDEGNDNRGFDLLEKSWVE